MTKTNRFFIIFISLAALCCGSFKLLADEDLPKEGQLAPDFSIMQLNGEPFKLQDYRGKQAVYVIFWNTWCTYCIKKIPKLKDAQTHLAEQIKVIAINTSLKDSLKKTEAFAQEYQLNYPLAFDFGKRITDLYGVWGTPTEFIIDINGVIIHRDGVPDDLRPHLAQWNRVAETATRVSKAK
ncbi:peroxiredoxin family protein [Aliikangiella sp. IMCC44653]